MASNLTVIERDDIRASSGRCCFVPSSFAFPYALNAHHRGLHCCVRYFSRHRPHVLVFAETLPTT